MKICIVVACFYPNISKDLVKGSVNILKKKKIKNYKIISTPGIFEIPFVISKNIKKYDGFIALGCVIKGQTPHFDFMSRSTIDAIMHLSITNKKPIGNGIITCLNQKQASSRSNPKKKNKGAEATIAALSLLNISK